MNVLICWVVLAVAVSAVQCAMTLTLRRIPPGRELETLGV